MDPYTSTQSTMSYNLLSPLRTPLNIFDIRELISGIRPVGDRRPFKEIWKSLIDHDEAQAVIQTSNDPWVVDMRSIDLTNLEGLLSLCIVAEERGKKIHFVNTSESQTAFWNELLVSMQERIPTFEFTIDKTETEREPIGMDEWVMLPRESFENQLSIDSPIIGSIRSYLQANEWLLARDVLKQYATFSPAHKHIKDCLAPLFSTHSEAKTGNDFTLATCIRNYMASDKTLPSAERWVKALHSVGIPLEIHLIESPPTLGRFPSIDQDNILSAHPRSVYKTDPRRSNLPRLYLFKENDTYSVITQCTIDQIDMLQNNSLHAIPVAQAKPDDFVLDYARSVIPEVLVQDVIASFDIEMSSDQKIARIRELFGQPANNNFFETQLAPHFERLEIPRDGNCLFQSLAQSTSFPSHEDLRQRIADYIESNPSEFEEFIETPGTATETPLQAHCRQLRQPGFWGGNIEICAFVALMKHQSPPRSIQIHVYDVKHPKTIIETPQGIPRTKTIFGSENADQEIYLLLENNHYNLIRRRS